MRKGDIRKQEILATAEQLFCRNGYEQTSVQDIIDCLHSSKGSFYHHYASKEALLEGICRNRAEPGTVFLPVVIFTPSRNLIRKELSPTHEL